MQYEHCIIRSFLYCRMAFEKANPINGIYSSQIMKFIEAKANLPQA